MSKKRLAQEFYNWLNEKGYFESVQEPVSYFDNYNDYDLNER